MADDLKKTVIIRKLNTDRIQGPGGEHFNEKFQKYGRKALQAAGFFEPVNGKAKYAIGGSVTEFNRENEMVMVKLSCHAEQDDRMKPEWGKTNSNGKVPDVKNEKDFLWALDGLAENFAPQVVGKFKGYFT
jgi:hypothetical protein